MLSTALVRLELVYSCFGPTNDRGNAAAPDTPTIFEDATAARFHPLIRSLIEIVESTAKRDSRKYLKQVSFELIGNCDATEGHLRDSTE